MALSQYVVNTLFSDFDVSNQCIELAGDTATGGSWTGLTITVRSGDATHTYTFANDLPPGDMPTRVLLGTAGFDFPAPDFVIPDGFLFTGGGTIEIQGGEVFTYGALPLDGAYMLDRKYGVEPLQVFNLHHSFGPGAPLPYATYPGATDGDDHLVANFQPSLLRGYAGNDVLEVQEDSTYGFGNFHLMEGGAGRDTVLVHARGGDVLNTFVANDALHVVFPMHSSVTLAPDVERLRLDDVVVAFDTHTGEAVWQANALLWAGLGVAPGIDELSQWTAVADQSAGIGALAQQMLDTYAPGIDTATLATHLFHSVFGRQGLPSEIEMAVDVVGIGKLFESNGGLFAWVASQEVNTQRTDDFTGQYALLLPGYFD